MAFKFEKLKVWQLALELAGEISEMVKTFPKDELFILISQVKRAADSVVLNIVEGSTLQSKIEFKRFPVIANRPALEVVACLNLSKQENILMKIFFLISIRNMKNLLL